MKKKEEEERGSRVVVERFNGPLLEYLAHCASVKYIVIQSLGAVIGCDAP